jgi:chromosome segregation ATPase
MEIKIKTEDEFHDAHVTIEIRATPGEAALVSERLYTAAEVGAAQASEAELVAAPLRRRIEEMAARLEKGHVCTEACRPNAHVAFLGRREVNKLENERDRFKARIAELERRFKARIAELERELSTARLSDQGAGSRIAELKLEAEASQAHQRVIEIQREVEYQRERADQNRAWAERAEGRVAATGLELADARHDLAEAHKEIERRKDQLGRISGAVRGPWIGQALNTEWERADTRAMAEAIRQVRDALLPETGDEPTSQA